MRAPSPLPVIGTTADLPNLEDHTLVSLDIEGCIENAIEIGIATCDTLTPVLPPHTGPSFVQHNNIECVTLRLRDIERSRIKHQELLRFGQEPSRITEDPAASFHNLLANCSRPPILVVFGATTELIWMKANCPALLTAFSACIDVQSVAGEASTKNKQPNLRLTLAALSLNEGFEAFPNTRRHHRAANDAVYTLAVFAALLHRSTSSPTLEIATAPKSPRLFYGRPKPAQKYPYTALIRTLDRSPLPLELDTAGKIYNYFELFNPITAGTGRKRDDSRVRKEQLSWSWICFATREDLESFQESQNETIFRCGKRIFIESQFIPGVTLSSSERKAKQIEDGDRIRQQRLQARLDREAPPTALCTV